MKFVALTTIIPFVVFSDILCAVSLRIASRAESKDDGKVSTMQEDTEDALLQGHLEVGKQRFTALCDCRSPNRQNTKFASLIALQCNPTKIALSEDHGASGLTPDVVRKMYGQPRDIALVDEDFQMFACMDDRISQPSLMTPGGDLGEFLLGLFVFSRLGNPTPLTLSQDDIVKMLTRYIQSSPVARRFYHCNDDQSLARMEKLLGIVGLDLSVPQAQHMEPLQKQLESPQNHGDIHFRALLSHPERYHIPADLVVNTIRAFYQLLWDLGSPIQDRLYLDILSGVRAPQAFIEIDEGDACHQAQKAPLLQPKKTRGGLTTGAFIVHNSAVEHRRRSLAEFFFQEAIQRQVQLNGMNEQELYGRLDKYGLQWLEATVAAAASDLKFYKMTFQ